MGRIRLLALLAFALPAGAEAAPAQLGYIELTPGMVTKFDAPLSPALQTLALTGGNPRVLTAKCAIIIPAGFDPAKPWPVLVGNAPQGSSALRGVPGFGGPAAEAGWITLAADGPQPAKLETTQWCVAMIEAAFDYLDKAWPGARRWPVVSAGFSGGAKRSAYVGAMLMEGGHRVIGLWMGGCNEDRATDALRWHKPGPAFFAVPIYLSSGLADPIATPAQQQAVADSMHAAGFKNVRLESYAGSHRMEPAQLAAGLRWFAAPDRK
jgi:hypothetical protein